MIAKENSSNDAISEKWRAGCSPSAVHVVCSQWDSADRHTPRNGRKEVFWWLGPCGLHVQTPRISPALLSVLSPWKGIKQRPLLYEAQHQVGSVLFGITHAPCSLGIKKGSITDTSQKLRTKPISSPYRDIPQNFSGPKEANLSAVEGKQHLEK